MYKLWIVIFFALSLIPAYSIDIATALRDIETNNKELKAARQQAESKKSAAGQNILLSDPSVEAGFMNSTGDEAISKKDFSIKQSFEFPTVYFKKLSLANLQEQLAEAKYKVIRREILLEAKLILMDYIVNIKKSEVLKIRFENSGNIYQSFKKRLESGDIGIIDFNKSKMELLTAKTLLQKTTIELDNATESLKRLNGGINLPSLEIENYKAEPIPQTELLKDAILKKDPDLLFSLMDIDAEEKNLSLKKWSALPKFDIAYKYADEGIESFSGISFGMSLPIFESNNTIKTARAELEYKKELRESIINRKIHETQAKIAQLETIELNLKEYNELFDNVKTLELLEKAFNLGELSAVEYFYEINYFYEIYDTYLELEAESLKLNAEIMSFQL